MTMTNKKTARTWALGALLALSLIMGCATNSAQNDIDYAKALVSSGQLKEGMDRLQVISAGDPSNSAARDAYQQSVSRYAAFLAAQAQDAIKAGRFDDADRLYKQVAALPGQLEFANKGLAEVSSARNAAPLKPVAADSKPLAPLPSTAIVPAAAPANKVQPVETVVLVPAEEKAVLSRTAQAKQASALAASTASPSTKPAIAAVPAAAKPVPQSSLGAGISPSIQEGLQRRISMQFKDAPVRSLFDIISKTSGLNILVDKDVSPDLRTSIFLSNTTVDAAIQKILLTTQLGRRVLDENTLLIYVDDLQKQHEHQELQVRAFYLANAEPKAVMNSLKVMVRAKDIVLDEKLNMIMMRDTAQAIAAAEKVVALLDAPEPEVMLEVTILEVSSAALQRLGINWPGALSLGAIPSGGTGSQLTLNDLLNLSSNTVSAAIGNVTLNASAEDLGLNVLANPRIRAKNREKAKILIGDRLPNITTTSTAGTATSNFVAQTIQYIDVGLKLEFQPVVFVDGQVVIKIALEVSTADQLPTTSNSGVVAYKIHTRTATTTLRLKDGENQILGGLIQDVDRKANNSIPGLGKIPLLGKLFGVDEKEKTKSEIVLSITPRLIRGITRPAADVGNFSIGTEASLRGRRADGGAADAAAINADPSAQRDQPSRESEAQTRPAGEQRDY